MEEIVRRITALIPTHPGILDVNDPFDLFDVPGFDVSDLRPSPSLLQAVASLAEAKRRYRESLTESLSVRNTENPVA